MNKQEFSRINTEKLSSLQQWESIKSYEEVYGEGYDTAGDYHWYGILSGHHIIKVENIT